MNLGNHASSSKCPNSLARGLPWGSAIHKAMIVECAKKGGTIIGGEGQQSKSRDWAAGGIPDVLSGITGNGGQPNDYR